MAAKIFYIKNKLPINYNFFFIFLLIIHFPLLAQNKQDNIISHDDSSALERIIVEKYYVADSTDYLDSTKNSLTVGSVTYRIFVDMKSGYNLQLVYGSPKHELFIETTSKFFNDKIANAMTGFNINTKIINTGNIALDSWITMGAAARGFTGILRSEDTVGYSFITNRPSLKIADGLTKGVLPDFKTFNLDLSFFNNDSSATRFSTKNGGWAAPGGVKGPTSENRVLIAQFTTTGKLSFKLNVQIGTPNGSYVKFVASDPEESEIKFDELMLK